MPWTKIPQKVYAILELWSDSYHSLLSLHMKTKVTQPHTVLLPRLIREDHTGSVFTDRVDRLVASLQLLLATPDLVPGTVEFGQAALDNVRGQAVQALPGGGPGWSRWM